MRTLGFLLLVALPGVAQPPAVAPFNLIIRDMVPVNFNGSIALGDFNGDGKPDLIGETAEGFNIRLNNGAGSFSSTGVTYPSISVPAGVAFSLFAVADFNRDGYADAVQLTAVGTYFYAGDGKGGLAKSRRVSIDTKAPPLNLVAADFNGDGFLDLAFGNFGGGLKVFLGSGTGDFQELAGAFTEKLPDPSSPRIYVTDLNGDGALDVMMIDLLPRTLAILMNDGTGHFHASQVVQRGRFSRPESIAVGDYDHDGKLDLAISYFVVSENPIGVHHNLELWKRDAGGQYALASTFATDVPSQATMLTADLDGDGNLDVIAGSNPDTTVYFGDGAGGFGRKVTLPLSGMPFVADLDGDSRPEIVVVSRKVAAIAGSGVLASRVLLTRDAPNPFTYGQLEFLTVSVAANPSAPAFPTGSIALFEGARAVATLALTNGVARFAVPFVAGVHTYRAVYNGDGSYGAGSAELVVAEAGQPATVSVLPTQDNLGRKIFSVTVRDAFGTPVSGVGVIFAAPVYGPSGLFGSSNAATAITDANGFATAPAFTTNGYAGTFSVTVTISGYPGPSAVIPLQN